VNQTNKILTKYASPVLVARNADQNAPFNFQEWYGSHTGVLPEQELAQYNTYLIDWYTKNQTNKTTQLFQLQERFLTFLSQIQTFYSKEIVLEWYNKIDLSNRRDLIISIPYFAKKLKDIALYYQELRRNIKQSKLKNNITGTNRGIEALLHNEILSNFTKRTNNTSFILPGSAWQMLPDLSSVVADLQIDIVELYDDTQYFNNTSTQIASSIQMVDNTAAFNFLSANGLLLNSADWIYSSTFNFNDVNDLIDSTYRDAFIKLSESILANDLLVTSVTPLSTKVDTYTLDFAKGKNFLYWPHGPYLTSNKTQYYNVPLSSSGLSERANPGESISTADTIFVKTEKGVQGAWLTSYTYITSHPLMQADIKGDINTIFKFPYPGFGLSSVDVPWTGQSFATQSSFNFLDKSVKTAIETKYWDYKAPTLTSVDIKLNNSTLDNYLYAAVDYNQADKVRTWDTLPSVNASMYSGNRNESWLYRFNNTDLPISVSADNIILWPYTLMTSSINVDDIPVITNNTCAPAVLSANMHYGMTAGADISSADKIYKIASYVNPDDTIIEGAWLSGSTIKGADVYYVPQLGLNLRVNAGETSVFVWTGQNTLLSDVFNNLQHDTSCPFLYSTRYKEASSCTCHQPNYTCFGHNGVTFDDNNRMADSIALVNPVSPFNISTWKGKDSKDYRTSVNFAWYMSPTNTWGDGVWSNNFILSAGCCYQYTRVNYNDIDPSISVMPFLRKSYNHSYNSQYIKWVSLAKDDIDGSWSKNTSTPSAFTLYPGNYINYKRTSTVGFSSVGSVSSIKQVEENRGSVWSSFDYITIGSGTPVVVTLPSPTTYTPSQQDPPFDPSRVIDAKWVITRPDLAVEIFDNTILATFVPDITGVYTISLTAQVLSSFQTFDAILSAIGATTSTPYVFNNIPPITAISPYAYTDSLTALQYNTCGFIFNTNLKGWNYSLSRWDGLSLGARPFWAKADTSIKTAISWGSLKQFDAEANIHTQPDFSDIVLKYNSYIHIINAHKRVISWQQPITLLELKPRVVWNEILFDSKVFNLSSELDVNLETLVVSATHNPSDIVFETSVYNYPQEIFYNAHEVFSWNFFLTATNTDTTQASSQSLQLFLSAQQPWLNIINTITPAIATYPNVYDLYSAADVGTYYTPQKIGITNAVSESYSLSSAVLSAGAIISNDVYNLAHGFEVIAEDSTWVKEPVESQAAAGNVKKNIAKNYQKFIPYQSSYESAQSVQYGILLPNSRQSPWVNDGTTWDTDIYEFANATQLVNVDTWAKRQILQRDSKRLINWASDVFGNQYGLYKDGFFDGGKLWVKTCGNTIGTAEVILEDVFTKYDTENSLYIYGKLIGSDIIHFDVFLDILYIQLDDFICFEKVSYDINLDNLSNTYNAARFINLQGNVTFTLPSGSTTLDRITITSLPWMTEDLRFLYIAVIANFNELEVIQYDTIENNLKPLNVTKDINLSNILTKINFHTNLKPVICSDSNYLVICLAGFIGEYKFGDNKTVDTFVNITLDPNNTTVVKDITVYSKSTPYSNIPVIDQSALHVSGKTDIELKIPLINAQHQNHRVAVTILIDNESTDCYIQNNILHFTPREFKIYYINFKYRYVDSTTEVFLYNSVTVNAI